MALPYEAQGMPDMQSQANALPPPPGDSQSMGAEECPRGTSYDAASGTCLPTTNMDDCWSPNRAVYHSPECYEARGENPVDNPPADRCPPGQVWDISWGICMNEDSPTIGGGGGPYGGGGANLNPDQPGYETTLPSVDPYDISDSRDWMNIFDYGGENANVNAINPQANPMAYEDINQFTDAAWENSMRHLQPQMELQDDRFEQELINKGIDPNSEAGKKALQNKQMGQNDLLNSSAFEAMGFGTGIQNQMFQQDFGRSQLANAMLQAQMGLSQRGHEFDTTANMSANDQAFSQMMGLEGLNYRDYLTGVDQSRYQDSLALALSGQAPGPSFQTFNTGLPQAPVYEYQGSQNYFNDRFGGQ